MARHNRSRGSAVPIVARGVPTYREFVRAARKKYIAFVLGEARGDVRLAAGIADVAPKHVRIVARQHGIDIRGLRGPTPGMRRRVPGIQVAAR